MSERKVEVDASSGGTTTTITPEEVESRAARKARRAQVLDRGMLTDRLSVALPDNLHGEWVPNNVVDIHRKEALGFRKDTEYASKRALHDKGDGVSLVGDCIFMVCDMEDYEILVELRAERYAAAHVPKKGKQMEERSFTSNADPESKPVAESKVHLAKGTDITNAIRAAST